MENSWFDILNKVKNKELSIEEGASRLAALENDEAGLEISLTGTSSDRPDNLPEIGWWKYTWLVLFVIGSGIFILGTILMAWSYPNRNFFWFICAWLAVLLSLLLLFLSWWSHQARWLHVRVQEKGGSRVAISMPLPLRLAAWLLRMLKPFIPQLQVPGLIDLPLVLDSLRESEGPLSVDVDDEGSQVRVYIQ